MGARENKQLLQSVFAELAQGNGKPFVEAMAEDFCWQAIGTTASMKSGYFTAQSHACIPPIELPSTRRRRRPTAGPAAR